MNPWTGEARLPGRAFQHEALSDSLTGICTEQVVGPESSMLLGRLPTVLLLTFELVTGVWRRKAIVTVGGWKSRTTVEDMDLSLRTYVNGWKAIYLTDVTCINEVSLLTVEASAHVFHALFSRQQPLSSVS